MRLKLTHLAGIAVVFCGFFAIYQSYPFLLFKVMEWQRTFNQQLSGSLNALNENATQAGITLILISFLYGVFHALGPGHGKFILTSYLSLEQTKMTQAMKISLIASLVQGLVAIALVSVLVVAFTLSRSYFNLTLKWVERASFLLMISFGIYWVMRGASVLFRSRKAPKIRKITALQKNSKILPLATHQSHTDCPCGHQHLPTSTQLNQPQNWKSWLMMIASIGIRPCSGAILVLFLAYTLNLYRWGIVATLAMAIGTGVTLTLFAWLVLFARTKAMGLSRWYLSQSQYQAVGFWLKIAIGLALILFGMTLFHSSFVDISTGSGLLKR